MYWLFVIILYFAPAIGALTNCFFILRQAIFTSSIGTKVLLIMFILYVSLLPIVNFFTFLYSFYTLQERKDKHQEIIKEMLKGED